jgi:hypothetical protein
LEKTTFVRFIFAQPSLTQSAGSLDFLHSIDTFSLLKWFTCGKCELSPTCFSCGEQGKITSPSVPIETSDSSSTPAHPPVAQPFADSAIAQPGPLPLTSNPPSLSSLIQKSYATSVGGRTDGDGDVEMGSTEGSMVAKVEGDEIVAPPMMTEEERELLFRCIRCKRGVHVSDISFPSILLVKRTAFLGVN